MATTCLSTENTSSIPVEEKAMQYYLYPQPVARYEDVVANPRLFMDTIGNFHAAMRTKFMIPIIGGKDLDLHRLFVEVTSRGGIKKVLEEKKWKEVTYSFSFPPSATNASFILKKYYMSLIHHFEQVCYFKAKAWTPVSGDTWQSTRQNLTSTSGMNKAQLPLPECQIDSNQVIPMKRQKTTIEEDSLPKASPEPSIGFLVSGIIDGKFESGYLCTVMIGGELLQGVLFQSTAQSSYQPLEHHHSVVTQCQTTSGNATQPLTMFRRRRRKKSEMKRRDPAHPKPNRSGYNFFFAEQHARLKPLHPGKDRDISRMIGELWNNISETKKVVYQEKAMKDKERYRIEMEHYRESLITGHVSNAAPLLQQLFNDTLKTDDEASPQTSEKELNSNYDKITFESKAKIAIGGEEYPMDVAMESNQPISVSVKDNEPVITETVFIQESVPDTIDETEKKYKNLDQELDIFQLLGSKVTNGVQYGTLPSS